MVAPGDFLLIELPGKRAPWRSSGAEASSGARSGAWPWILVSLLDSSLGSGLEGALDIGAVTQTLVKRLEVGLQGGLRGRFGRQTHGGARRAVSATA